jgi:phosphate uptake regulator
MTDRFSLSSLSDLIPEHSMHESVIYSGVELCADSEYVAEEQIQEFVSPEDWSAQFRDIIAAEFNLESRVVRQDELAAKRATEIIDSIVDLTTNLFGENVRIYASHDPDFPETRYTILAVESSRPVAELLELELEWARGVNKISPGFDSFRLKLIPVYESK